MHKSHYLQCPFSDESDKKIYFIKPRGLCCDYLCGDARVYIKQLNYEFKSCNIVISQIYCNKNNLSQKNVHYLQHDLKYPKHSVYASYLRRTLPPPSHSPASRPRTGQGGRICVTFLVTVKKDSHPRISTDFNFITVSGFFV